MDIMSLIQQLLSSGMGNQLFQSLSPGFGGGGMSGALRELGRAFGYSPAGDGYRPSETSPDAGFIDNPPNPRSFNPPGGDYGDGGATTPTDEYLRAMPQQNMWPTGGGGGGRVSPSQGQPNQGGVYQFRTLRGGFQSY